MSDKQSTTYATSIPSDVEWMPMEDSEKITIRIPKRDLRYIDLIMKLDGYSTRSEVIRAAIREFTDDRVDFLLEKMEKLEKTEEKRARLLAFEEKFLHR